VRAPALRTDASPRHRTTPPEERPVTVTAARPVDRTHIAAAVDEAGYVVDP